MSDLFDRLRLSSRPFGVRGFATYLDAVVAAARSGRPVRLLHCTPRGHTLYRVCGDGRALGAEWEPKPPAVEWWTDEMEATPCDQ